MNTDIRIATGFLTNRKTVKLRRRLGDGGVLALLALWCYAAANHPEGLLPADEEGLEIAAGWDRAGELVPVLVSVGFLELVEGGYWLHDWSDHQSYACRSGLRTARSKVAVAVRLGDSAGEAFWRGEVERLTHQAAKPRVHHMGSVTETETETEPETETGSDDPSTARQRQVDAPVNGSSTARQPEVPAEAAELAGEFFDLLVAGDEGSALARKGRAAAVRGWGRDFDLLTRVDGQEAEAVREVMAAVSADRVPRGEGGYCHFATVRSGKKLRARFDQLRAGLRRSEPGVPAGSRLSAETWAIIRQAEAEG
jgi:hypothetical protein